MARREKNDDTHKKYVRYERGAKLYDVCLSTFRKWAEDADAIHKIGKVVLVNVEKLDNYLESF